MDTLEELVPKVRDLLHTMQTDEGVQVFEDGRLAVVPRQAVQAPTQTGQERPVASFLAEHTEMPEEEIRDRIRTGLSHRNQPPFQAG